MTVMDIPTGADILFVAISSVIAGFVIFPIVFLLSYYYEKLEKKYPKTPKILLMLFCTIIGALITETIIYAYVKYSFLPVAVP